MRVMPLALIALALAGCQTATPVRVTRFHLNEAIERAAIAVAPDPAATNVAGLEADLYAKALTQALAAQGFAAPSPGAPAPLIASFTLARTTRELAPARPPVTIGLGGGGFGGGVGGGGSVAFGVGKPRGREAYVTELSVQIKRAGGGGVIWEGRARSEDDTRSPAAQPAATAQKLAAALLKGFPGESGRTISVP